MEKKLASQSAFFNLRVLFGFGLPSIGASLVIVALSANLSATAQAQGARQTFGRPIVVPSYYNDVSRPLRDMPAWPEQALQEHEAAENPLILIPHKDAPDLMVAKGTLLGQLAPSIPAPILNFAGIPFPGVVCSCAPPDTNGEVGATQYVQIVNEGYQVFNKATGASVLGPVSINSVWSGFGGVCQSGSGDPVVMYDQIANRWIISQFAGSGHPTDECIAVSTTSDATGSYNRYGFHLGKNFFDYPHLGVWPDAYYMSMNVFNSSGTAYLGPQAFAFDRAKMLAGLPATFVTFPALGSNQAPFLPADLDGSTLPPSGAPNSFVQFPSNGNYNVYHFHADFAGSGSTFALFASPNAAGFTQLCPRDRNCIPQLGQTLTNKLDAIADRLMFRLPYRNFGNHEAIVGNFTVSASGTAGIRFFELRGVSAGPVTVFQEGTYAPDSTNRWMASVAMDGAGNMAAGFSASDATIFPQIRYASRLKNDPLGTFAQGEAHLFDGTGAQIGTGNRWGDYSDLTVDPVDDSTFWFTSEYYDSTSSFNWRTRIGSFKIATGGGGSANLVRAASRLTHGSAGTFDIDMPLSGNSGVEDRDSSSYLAVFTFDVPVTSGSATVQSGTATAGTPTFSGNEMRVPLTGVANAQNVVLHVSGVNGGSSSSDVTFGFLIADVNSSRKVGRADSTEIKGQIGQPVTSANFRDDVSANGAIGQKDVNEFKTHKNTQLP